MDKMRNFCGPHMRVLNLTYTGLGYAEMQLVQAMR